jgi:hypothetical protein
MADFIQNVLGITINQVDWPSCSTKIKCCTVHYNVAYDEGKHVALDEEKGSLDFCYANMGILQYEKKKDR